MFVIVPNWNLSFEPRVYKSLSALNRYADKNNVLLTSVDDIKSKKYYSKKYPGIVSPSDYIYIGW